MNIKIRTATILDKDDYFYWVNLVAVRVNSFSKDTITFNEHAKWFEDSLSSKKSFMYVGCIGGSLVGQVRFDLIGEINEFSVDIHLAPDFMGQGLGSELLAAGLKRLRSDVDCPLIVEAVIFTANKASIKCFKRNNFILTSTCEIKNIRCKKFKYHV